jgi:hypothetical protein
MRQEKNDERRTTTTNLEELCRQCGRHYSKGDKGMNFREMYGKARVQQREILEYQNSRVSWLFDTLKVADEVGFTVRVKGHCVSVYYGDMRCWKFAIKTGCMRMLRFTPHEQGNWHQVNVVGYWGEEATIEQIKKGEKGLDELRTAVQAWLANQIAKREAASTIHTLGD